MGFNKLSGTGIEFREILYQIRMLTVQIHQSRELSETLNIIVNEVRTTLESDRALIYRFLADGDGVVAEESVIPGWQAIQGKLIYDPCFQAKWVEKYQAGHIGIIEDIDAKSVDPCYKELLTQLQIRANLVVPILVNTQDIDGTSSSALHLWGLLIFHQCSSPRQWSDLEIEFTQLIATELGIALQYAYRNQHGTQKRSPQLYQDFQNSKSGWMRKLRLTRKTLQKALQNTLTTAAKSIRYISTTDYKTDITIRKQAELALQQQIEQERMVYTIAQHIHRSLNLEEILNTTVTEVRHFLQTDRVIIYRFNPDWSGVIVTESVAEPWQAIIHMEITDDYLVATQGQSYQQDIIVTPDIYTAGLADCHLKLLEKLQVKAKLVVPILHSDCCWGLLIVHHCRRSRAWQSSESELLQQLATQLGIAIQQSELYQQLHLANQDLQNLAMVDQLTQIGNRRFFDINLNQAWYDLLQSQYCISLLLCDIDFFKKYNDTYGHATGDECLHLVAQTFQQTVKRSQDLVARYGGEEFVIILLNTDSAGAVRVAQEIHEAIHQLNIPHTASTVKPFVTLSIGIATVIPMTDMLPLDLIEAADQALYQAKMQGRNRSVVSSLSIPLPD